ncbi:substrate-binding periplasmic protein [Cereibacter johrii]|uniref:substrate-binding periplasmic protein n=1 Tax=Cereibacter johrii TaxID=445629 RepID=UPI003CEAF36B
MRLLFLLPLLAVSSLGAAARGDAQTDLRLAVRADVPPFVWKDADSGEFNGFFWDICTAAVIRAGYRVGQPIEISADRRAAFLATGEGGFDILCDPVTITLARLRALNDRAPNLQFSPILFFAAGSSAMRGGRGIRWLDEEVAEQKPCEAFIREAEGAAEEGAATDWWPPRFTPQILKGMQIWGVVRGTTTERTVRRAAEAETGTRICLRDFESHAALVQAFCTGSVFRYFGDIDIVRASIRTWEKSTGQDCTADLAPAGPGVVPVADSYEPYALVVAQTPAHPNLPSQIALELYGMFSDGTIDRLYAGHFRSVEPIEDLRTLFRINAVPAGCNCDEAATGAGGR